MIDGRVRAGRLFLIHRGVYAVGHPQLTFDGRCMAAVLATEGWASHRTAAALWGLRPKNPRVIHVVVCTRGSQRPGLHVHRTRSLTEKDVTYRHRVPVTNLRRTLHDLAAIATPTEFEENLQAAERIHGFDRTKYKRTDTVRGNLEPIFLKIVRDAGLPAPQTNVPFQRWSIDALWPEHNLAVEIDDWQTHRTRHAFRNDRAKGNAIVAAGYRLLRFTADDLADPPQVVARLRAEMRRSASVTRDAGTRPERTARAS